MLRFVAFSALLVSVMGYNDNPILGHAISAAPKSAEEKLYPKEEGRAGSARSVSSKDYFDDEQPGPTVIPIEAQNIIDSGMANGLTEVNQTQAPDHERYRDNSGMVYLAPPGGWRPNPSNYQGRMPSSIPSYFYRTIRDCKSKKILDEQVIFTYNGYGNYIGGSRYEAQCVLDGSADTFYEETNTRQGR